MSQQAEIVSITQCLVDAVYANTEYEDKEDAESTFSQLRTSLPVVCASDEGRKLVQKFTVLGTTATTEENFNDMVKIMWRVVKPLSQPPLIRLSLLFLCIGSMLHSLSRAASAGDSARWRQRLEKWLGKQLTIGGKGVVGEGEGSVVERVRQFFSTPYLHEFD